MNPPANWYPDPTGRHGQRYWDGEQWTEHVFTDGVQGVDPLDAAGTHRGAAAEEAVAADAEPATDAAGDPAPEPSGLFADAGEPPTEQATWEPEDQAQGSGGDEQPVAPEVDPEDVVGSLDEVSEASAAGAPEPEDAFTEGSDEDDATAGDFSDAFMVTPETVSRLVSRQAATEPPAHDEAQGPPAEEPVEAPGDPQEGEVQPVGAAPPDQGAPAPEPEAGTTATTGVVDAPPPSVPQSGPGEAPTPLAEDGLGITGDLVDGGFAERAEAGPVALQNSRLLRCSLGGGSGVIARQGTMVAYQGAVEFERQGAGGVTRALKRAATGEGLAMMRAEGSGDVFFADGAQHVFVLHLEGGPGLSVNGRNVLAFSADLEWDVERVKGATLLAGGLFNTSLTGTGWVALVSDGEPVVLRTDEASTHVDVNALVAWSGGLTTRITNTVSAKSLVGLGSGEAFQMAFDGVGIVIVQPSEGPTGGATAT